MFVLVRLTENFKNACKMYSMKFSIFSTPLKNTNYICIFIMYLAQYQRWYVVTAHLGHLHLVPNLLKIFGTPSRVFVQLR